MKATIWLTCLLTAALVSPVNADVLEMPEPEQVAPEPAATSESGTFSVTLPGRGMTKDQVEDRFGSPPEKVRIDIPASPSLSITVKASSAVNSLWAQSPEF